MRWDICDKNEHNPLYLDSEL